MKFDNSRSQEQLRNVLPWWTWIAPLFIFFAASCLSSLYRISPNSALIYLPTSLGIILVNWWGPQRVLPMLYLNAIICGSLWGIEPWYLRPVYTLPEVSLVFLSWYLFSVRHHGKYWLPDTRHLNLFLFWGVIIPLCSSLLLFKLLLFLLVDRPLDVFSSRTILVWLREFMCNFGITLPFLYFLTPAMSRLGLLSIHLDFGNYQPSISGKNKLLIISVYIVILVVSLLIGLDKYWFVYGIFSLWFALRYGFGLAILTNSFIFLLAYIIPVVREIEQTGHYVNDPVLVNIYVGTCLLYVFSAFTGRVMDDINVAKMQITDQLIGLERANSDLKVANKELDHFVYSVSHDLTAPLKSIKGLTNLSELTENPADHKLYFKKIEESVKRLEQFIVDVLDFSHIKRAEADYQRIELKELVDIIIDDLRYLEGFDDIELDCSDLKVGEIITDKTSIKVIMANLIGNAFAYRKRSTDFQTKITIRSHKKDNDVFITVEDNGEGIKQETQKRIFEMFYRGTSKSQGSGLGLYIASEAAHRVKGRLTVESEVGKGSMFTLRLPAL